jgi:hypothetical protein
MATLFVTRRHAVEKKKMVNVQVVIPKKGKTTPIATKAAPSEKKI